MLSIQLSLNLALVYFSPEIPMEDLIILIIFSFNSKKDLHNYLAHSERNKIYILTLFDLFFGTQQVENIGFILKAIYKFVLEFTSSFCSFKACRKPKSSGQENVIICS